jgi:pimeloyl-ACP methyl ester carboxylesterase
VVHDWGGLGLVTAQDLHERVNRIVIMNAVPLLPGYRWHRIARVWRTPVLGEVAMGLTTKSFFKAYTKPAQASGEAWPKELLDHTWKNFDQGTQRAILKLYRSAPPQILEQAGERLSQVQAETLVLWGEQDPYIPTAFAQAYAEHMPNATVELLSDAGHWLWLDRPDVVDKVSDFLNR